MAITTSDLAANAWPATINQTLGGWRLRFAGGITRRANSVGPNGSSEGIALEERLRIVEVSYDRRGYPARYHISPAGQPVNLDQALAERGYAIDAPSEVRVATIGDLLSATEDTAGLDATVIEAFTEPWLAAYRRSEGVAAGTGMGVLERGWLGLFCMATPPDFRRQGGAKAILRSLANWARRRHG